MPIPYIVNYKIKENDKLKKVSYHGKLTYPIYIQISFRRRTTLIKSYYFDFFSNPRFILEDNQETNSYTNIEEIILKERKLLEYIVNKVENTDTLESILKMYYYYSKDICSVLEEGFALTMNLFLREKKLNFLAKKLIINIETEMLYFLLQDLSTSIKPEIFTELMSNAQKLKQYYVPFIEYLLKIKSNPFLYLSVMEWQDPSFIDEFSKYLKSKELNDKLIIENITKLIVGTN